MLASCMLFLPASFADKHRGTTAREADAVRSCTDLSGEAVPCPGEADRTVKQSAEKSAAVLHRSCVDLSGEQVPCPSDEKSDAITTRKNDLVSLDNDDGGHRPLGKGPSVTPVSSNETITRETPCHDLLGEPASCPTQSDEGSRESAANSVYEEPKNKAPASLERSLPRDIYLGQKEFWSWPSRMRLDDAYWAVPFGIVTGGLISADQSIKNALPQNPNTIKRFKSLSNYGALAYGGLVGGSYVLGKMSHRTYLSDTAWLAGESGLNSLITTYALKYALARQRPTEGNGKGDFFSSGQSFPSEHSAAVWSVATVFAGRYPGIIPKLGLFGGAGLISFSRVVGQQHFTSDAFVGSALGYYFGRQALRRYQREHETDYLYGSFVREEESPSRTTANMGSPYVPLDSWVYAVFDRLAAKGEIGTAFSDMRPWTRMECARLLDEYQNRMPVTGADSTVDPDYRVLANEFAPELRRRSGEANLGADVESVYTRISGISGEPLRDGYHFAQTLINDYGRPYGQGVNAIFGTSMRATAGPFAAYVRAEYQRSGTNQQYNPGQQAQIAIADIGGAVPPANPFPSVSRGRIVEGYVAFAFKNMQLSAGQQSFWWGPTRGGSLLYTNNAESIPMVLFSTSSPSKVPFLGATRFQFFVGKLSGHQYIQAQTQPGAVVLFGPNVEQPYIEGQKVAFKPTPNLEFSVSKTGVFGGPLVHFTADSFFRSLFSRGNTTPGQQVGAANDPGDRRSAFDISYRVPGIRNWLTVYLDSMTDDEISPLGYPRRSAMNPGFYLARVPGIHKLDFRAEGVYTNLPGLLNQGFFYSNSKFREGYTNNLNLMASWIGRQGYGIQTFTTYNFSPQRTLQFGYRNQHVDKSFLEGGSLTDANVKADFFLRNDLSVSSFLQYEKWTFPFLSDAAHSNMTAAMQITYWPKWKKE